MPRWRMHCQGADHALRCRHNPIIAAVIAVIADIPVRQFLLDSVEEIADFHLL